MDSDELMALECWARSAVRRMLVRALLGLSQDFAMDAKLALSTDDKLVGRA